MNHEYESARMKARKLAALAAMGVGGERDAARRKLADHLARHGMSWSELDDEDQRQSRELDAGPCPRALRKELTGLLANCLAYVLQRNVTIHAAVFAEALPPKTKGGKPRRVRKLIATAPLTPAELEDWKACFTHYRPHFLATRAALHEAAKCALDGFLNQHSIFPPSTGDIGAEISPAELAALSAAMRASQGDSWQPAKRLTHTPLLS